MDTKEPARQDWAEDGIDEPTDLASQLPAPKITKNKDGSETIVTVSLNEKGQKVKRTQRIKKTIKTYTERAGVVERRKWDKFGPEAGRPSGPSADTTTIGENIILRPVANFKTGNAAAAANNGQGTETAEETRKTDALKKMQIKCRICSGDHFTTKCPFKDTMAPEGDANADPAAMPDMGMGGGDDAGGAGGSSYVPPHMRKGASGATAAGSRMDPYKTERDDLATLRVTNISDQAVEDELWQIFGRFGHVTRVFLAKDRVTNMPKGFAFISFADRDDAQKAKTNLEGYGLHHLILTIDFATKRPDAPGGGGGSGMGARL